MAYVAATLMAVNALLWAWRGLPFGTFVFLLLAGAMVWLGLTGRSR